MQGVGDMVQTLGHSGSLVAQQALLGSLAAHSTGAACSWGQGCGQAAPRSSGVLLTVCHSSCVSQKLEIIHAKGPRPPAAIRAHTLHSLSAWGYGATG